MEQLIAHLLGDYILQSHTEARKKTQFHKWAVFHALKYTAPFVFVTQSQIALLVIFLTHWIVDRYRLARYVNYAKNAISMAGKPVTATGYPEETPAWLGVWLLVITDNTIHLITNYLAIKYL